MILILLFFTLIIIISYPIIGYKIFKAFQKKNKSILYRLSAVFIFLILLPGFFWKILPGSDLVWYPIEKIQDKNYNKKLTGLEFNYGDIIYENETQRAFNGDGYSIWIYEIDNATAEYFINPNKDFYNKYPQTTFRKQWKSEFWKKTPFNIKEQDFLDFANTDLKGIDFTLEELLNENGNYYSYQYYMHSFSDGTEYIGNIDFYIICPKRKIIVQINHNT